MGRTALVTGGTRGIGAAIANALKEAGHSVAVTYVGNQQRADAFSAETGIPIFKCDASDPEAAEAGIRRIEAAIGPIEVLVNNAGITRDGLFHKMDYSAWRDVMRTNLDSMYAMTRPVIEGMRERNFGRIVNISSVNGQKGQLGQTNYTAAKAGVVGFTKSLAIESARKGITVNCICPGYVDTDMVAAVPEKVMQSILLAIPMNRLGKAEEVGALVVYAVSDAAAFMTGAVLAMNGGQYMANG